MKSAGEKAMALVDGQLAPAEVPSLVQELARNAALVAELQEYLAMSRARIGSPYAVKADEPTPRRLIDAVMHAPAWAPRRMPPSTAGGRLIAWLCGSRRVPAWSLAAAPTLAAATAFAVALVILPVGRGGGLVPIDLGPALERTASGKEVALAALRPMLSFNSKRAGWCRQFQVQNVRRQTSHALACREKNGAWQVVASTAPRRSGGYMPAGADPRKVIDDLAGSMIEGEPLSLAAEAAAIGSGWQHL